jgi:hypothetical protein
MRACAVILWLGGSAAISTLALALWYRMTLRRFHESDDDLKDARRATLDEETMGHEESHNKDEVARQHPTKARLQ